MCRANHQLNPKVFKSVVVGHQSPPPSFSPSCIIYTFSFSRGSTPFNILISIHTLPQRFWKMLFFYFLLRKWSHPWVPESAFFTAHLLQASSITVVSEQHSRQTHTNSFKEAAYHSTMLTRLLTASVMKILQLPPKKRKKPLCALGWFVLQKNCLAFWFCWQSQYLI